MSEEFLLVDTSFLVALLDVQDSLHQRAEEIERELASLKLIFTDVVYGETLSEQKNNLQPLLSLIFIPLSPTPHQTFLFPPRRCHFINRKRLVN